MAVDMGKMVGPLPTGAWVAVVGGGLAFMLYTRKQAAVPATDSTMVPADQTGAQGVGDGSVGGFTSTVPTAAPGSGVDPSVAPTTITTNEEWGHAATNWLIAQGYNPAVADSAIRKYLDQETAYSSQEFALVVLAIGHVGATPTPLPAPIFGQPAVPVIPKPPAPKPPSVTPPVVHPPTKKPAVRYYTVRPGDYLVKIARQYHGVTWQEIYNANRSGKRRADGTMGIISNPNLIRPGWRLIIP